MKIPNVCLVLKLNNGKVVSIANGQTESHSHPVGYYNIDSEKLTMKKKMKKMHNDKRTISTSTNSRESI